MYKSEFREADGFRRTRDLTVLRAGELACAVDAHPCHSPGMGTQEEIQD